MSDDVTNTPFSLTWKNYGKEFLVIHQFFPQGLNATNFTDASKDPPAGAPFFSFPSFNFADGKGPSLGFLTWKDTFVVSEHGVGLKDLSGLTAGPIVLFDESWNTTVIVSYQHIFHSFIVLDFAVESIQSHNDGRK